MVLAKDSEGRYCIRCHGDAELAKKALEEAGVPVEKTAVLSEEEAHFALLTAPVSAELFADAKRKLAALEGKLQLDSILRVEG